VFARVNYVASRLAPADKLGQMIFWSGDAIPGLRRPNQLSYYAGMPNVNAGRRAVRRSDPS